MGEPHCKNSVSWGLNLSQVLAGRDRPGLTQGQTQATSRSPRPASLAPRCSSGAGREARMFLLPGFPEGHRQGPPSPWGRVNPENM